MNLQSDFVWVDKHVVLAVHAEQVARHGGLAGIREDSLLAPALARPKNLKAYENASIAKCAAACIYGIIKNHPFLDGNKRTGFVVGITFLLLNGYYINASESDVAITILSVASGGMTEPALIEWLESKLIKP
ncbi:MAG: type II toxin-antitoxin system death-on-curing family toxin [Marinoscillum sp.]